jgi:PAS domain S-box-containing protein
VESTIIGFSIVQDGRVVFMNPALQEILGAKCVPCAVEELVRGAIHPSDAPTFLARLASLRNGESDRRTMDLRLRRRRTGGGHDLGWVRLHVTDIPWRGKKAILASVMDVSKAKELEMIALNQERLATLGKVASGIAHEIRNPLSALNIQVARMQQIAEDAPGLDAASRDAVRRALTGVVAASGKIEAVIRRALDFSRPLSIPMAALSINECIREAAEMAASLLVQNGVALSTALAEAQPRCRGDRHLLEQVFLNLLLNASQAMEGQPEARKIRVASDVDGDSVVVSIADTGPGVPEELRDRIFEPFFTTRPSGTGIGLSISRKIVVEHGGSIGIGKSALGGALFTVSLPLLAADLSATDR